MPTYVPAIAELESALKKLHNPEALRQNPLAALDLVHKRVDAAQRVTQPTQSLLPWIYGYELAALLRERIEQLQLPPTPHDQAAQRATTRPQLYAQILQLRYIDDRSWNEIAQIVGLAAGHIQNKLKRPAIQRLLGDLLEQRTTTQDQPPTQATIAAHTDAPAYQTNLPAPGEFIGRQAEVDLVLSKLRRRRMPIIEISGVGGVGKSALAKHIGWRALEEGLFDAVIWLCARQDHLTIAGVRSIAAREALRSLDDLLETAARAPVRSS
jgi:hypothetical protein